MHVVLLYAESVMFVSMIFNMSGSMRLIDLLFMRIQRRTNGVTATPRINGAT